MIRRKEVIVKAMDSMLGSAQLEAQPGITFKKFLIELEFLREYPKEGEAGKFSPGQVKYIKTVLDSNFRVRDIDGQKYYVGQGLMI